MPETRIATMSDSLVSLSASYSKLISRQQTLVEAIHRQAEDTARNSAALDRMIEMLEKLQFPRADKQTTEAQPPLLPTPTPPPVKSVNETTTTPDSPLLDTPTGQALSESSGSIIPHSDQPLQIHNGGAPERNTGVLSRVPRVEVPIFQGEVAVGWICQMERYLEHNHVTPYSIIDEPYMYAGVHNISICSPSVCLNVNMDWSSYCAMRTKSICNQGYILSQKKRVRFDKPPAKPPDDLSTIVAENLNDDNESEIVDVADTEVISSIVSVEYSSRLVLDHVEMGEENFETKFCVSNTVSDLCLLPVCGNAAVYLSSIPLAHKTFNGNWCSMQVFYIAAVYLKPPWEPSDGEFKFMSLPMSKNYEIENINEEGLRIVWREAETKKRVTIAIESLLKIDTDAEWDFVDHSSTLRHGNDGVILLVWFEKPPPLPPEIERGLQGRFTWTKKKHDSELVKRHSEFINYSISPLIKHCFMELELYKVGGTHDGKKLEVVCPLRLHKKSLACLIDDPITDDIRFNQLLSSSLHALQSLPLKIEKVKNLQNSDLSQSWFKGFMVRVVLQCKGLEILNLSRYNFAESYPYGFESSLGVRVLEKLDVFYDKYNGLITCNLGDLSRLQDGSVLGELSSTRRLSVINIATVVSDIISTATNAVGTGLSFHVEKIGEHADEAIKPKKISFLFLEVWGQINSLRVTFSNWKEVRSKTMMKKFQYYDEVVGRVFERLSTSIDTYFRGDYSDKTIVDWLSDEFKRYDDMYLPMDKQPSHQITDVDEKINRELPPTAHGLVNAETFWTTSQPSLGAFGITCIKDYVEINFIGYLEPTIDDVGFICLFAPFSESLVTRDAAMLAVILSDQTNYEAQGLLLFAVPQQSFGLKTVGATTKSTQHYLSL